MPFKSKAQQRFMFAAEARGDVPKGTAKRWAHHTDDIKDLPEKKAMFRDYEFAPSAVEALDVKLAAVREELAQSVQNIMAKKQQASGLPPIPSNSERLKKLVATPPRLMAAVAGAK